jgi:hypothetical protein
MPGDSEAAEHEVFGANTATPVRHNATMREYTDGVYLGCSCGTRKFFSLQSTIPLFSAFLPFAYEIISACSRPNSVVMSGCVISEVANQTMLNEMTSTKNKPFKARDPLPLEWCVRCNRPKGLQSAVVQAATNDVLFILISLLIVLLVELMLFKFLKRMRRSIYLMEYGVVITNASCCGENCNHWSLLVFLLFLIFVLYGILGRMMQYFSFTEVEIDCQSLLGVVLNPRADDVDTLSFIPGGKSKEILSLLATAVPFLLLTTSTLGFMLTRLSDRYTDFKFNLLVEKPWLLTEMQQTLLYGLEEAALEKACKQFVGSDASTSPDPLTKLIERSPNDEKIRQMFEKLIEDKALTKLDKARIPQSQPPRCEPVIATIGVSEMARR